MYLLSLILSDLVQEWARADLWLQTQDHCLPEHAHNGGQWGSVLRRRRICRQGLQRHGHRGIQMHCPCDQEISETSRVCIQSSVIGNLELFPFLSELNLKELMFLLCYFFRDDMATADAQKAAGDCSIYNPCSLRNLAFSAPSVISGTYIHVPVL